MEIGDRIQVSFGNWLRQANFDERMPTTAAAARNGYLFVWRQGVVVAFEENVGSYLIGVMLDDDTRSDGSPDVRWFEPDDERSIAQVAVLIEKAVMPKDEAANLYVRHLESIDKAIQEHNAQIQMQIDRLGAEFETRKAIADTIEYGRPRTQEQREALWHVLNSPIYNLRGTMMKPRVR